LKRPISLNSFKVVLIHGWHPTQKKEEDAKAVTADSWVNLGILYNGFNKIKFKGG